MRKSILSVSVTAALTIPAIATAQQPTAVPTLDKVLEASGISLSGYVDAAYQHADRDIQTPNFSTRVFDSQNNAFVLHQIGVQIAKQPKEGFGGLVNFTAGKDAAVIHSFDTTTESQFDVTQAYGQYASGPLTVIFGKFVTLHGTEVIWSPSNANFSRSILFGSVPFTHTGVRATYALSDKLMLMAGLNNGWDQVNDTNKGKTIELGATVTPIKPVSVSAVIMSGKENISQTNPPLIATPGAPEGKRSSLGLLGSYSVSDALTLNAEFLNVSQENAPDLVNGGTKTAKYNGIAGYATYQFAPKWKGTVRAESFDDKDGLRFGLPAGTTSATKYREVTLTAAYLAADNVELRGEVRRDHASQAVFTDGASLSKSLTTLAVQALYKF
jgi:putative OmpL-like beta-barrel porin-2